MQNSDIQTLDTEGLFRTTVENLPVNLFVCDVAGRLLYLNPQLATMVAAMCGCAPDKIVGLQGLEVWPPPIWEPLSQNLARAVATGDRQSYELAATLPNGQHMVRQWTVVPLRPPEGAVRQLLVMSYDITAQRRLLEQAREADKLKADFIAVLSHELRNPLGAIRTSLFLLDQEEVAGDAKAQARRVIERQVSHLVRMVDDLLDVTRIAQKKINLRLGIADLNGIVRDTLEDNRIQFDRAGVRLVAALEERPILVNADGARIAQVLTNLLSNAVKFTPTGGTTTVSVSREDGSAVIAVGDTGRGIAPALLPRIFEPFVQGDTMSEHGGSGLGIGLALVKGLVELHGGTVRASSGGRDRGAELVVRLQLATAPADQPAADVRGDIGRATRRVLIIEDDSDNADSLLLALSVGGHVVEVARDGLEGLAKVSAFAPDVILCDLGLPGLSGYEVARAVRADVALRSTCLVALSGHSQPDDIAAAAGAGFDRHLAKPASVEEIRRIVAESPARARP